MTSLLAPILSRDVGKSHVPIDGDPYFVLHVQSNSVSPVYYKIQVDLFDRAQFYVESVY
jgi:hypothetical protein